MRHRRSMRRFLAGMLAAGILVSTMPSTVYATEEENSTSGITEPGDSVQEKGETGVELENSGTEAAGEEETENRHEEGSESEEKKEPAEESEPPEVPEKTDEEDLEIQIPEDDQTVDEGESEDSEESAENRESKEPEGQEPTTEETEMERSIQLSSNDIASGSYKDITWVIDASGKLTVSGTGEFAESGRTPRDPKTPWYPYRGNIVSAEIHVKDMTDASHMFDDCQNLMRVDLGGFDTSKVTDMSYMFTLCFKLTDLDVSSFHTDNVTDMSWMFYCCRNLENLDVSSFHTDNVTDMSYMFNGCSNLTSLDVGGFHTGNVTDMEGMFNECNGLTSLDLRNFDTTHVTNMRSMFGGRNLTSLNLHSFDTSNVTDMGYMFSGCYSLTNLDLRNFDTGKVTNMSGMFNVCNSLTSLDVSSFYTDNVTDMGRMFGSCFSLTNLDLRNFDTGKVTNMSDMFNGCNSLTSLDVSGFHTDNVTDMSDMFNGCNSLTSLDVSGFHTGSVTTMREMFFDCSSLTSLDLSGFDTGNVNFIGSMFYGCRSLENLDLSSFDTSSVTGGMNLMFYGCSSLTSLDLSSFNTSQVMNMDRMFAGCSSLTSLDVSSFDTSKVTGMWEMFNGCSSLTSLDVSGFDTSSVGVNAEVDVSGDMYHMFAGCSSLVSLDLSSFDISNVGRVDGMLKGCDKLNFLLTPKNCAHSYTLPVTADTDKWYDEDGTEYTELPMNLSHSIALYKNGYPGDGSTKKLVYVKDVNIEDKVYDAIPNLYTGTAVVVDQSGNPISGMTLTHSYSGTLADGSAYVGTTDAPSQAGNYTLSFQITGTDAEQYNLYKPSYRFRINRKEVTVIAESVKVEKGGQLPGVSDLKYTVDGLLENDVLVKAPSLKYSEDNISTDQLGRYEIIPYDADAGNNYSVKYVNGTLTIGSASSPGPSDPVYGDVWPEDIPEDGVIPQGLWVAGLTADGYDYTGKAIKPAVRVYDYKTRLKEKIDYTIAYTRNTKVYGYASSDQGFDAKKSPAIIVNAKGNYSGKETLYFKIQPLDIGTEDFAADNITIAYRTGSVQKPIPDLLWHNKKLKNKTDFTVTYYDSSNHKRDSVKEAGKYFLVLAGKGNFSGTRKIQLTVSEELKLINKMSVAKIKNQIYTGNAIIPTLVVKDKGVELTAGEQYEVSYSRNTEVGTAYAVITGIEEKGYSGTKRVSFQITGTPVNKATVTGLTGRSFSYEGVDWEPQLTLDIAGKTLTPEKDYVATWQKNLNAGTASVVITGKGAYTGTLKKTFKIKKFDVAANADSRFMAELEQETVPYAKGGAKPKVVVKFRKGDGNWQLLVEGQDYTLSYQNHTAINNGSRTDKQPTVIVKGKGNFSGKYDTALTYQIVAQDIHNLILTTQDRTYREKKNIYATKVTVTDLDGKVLKVGRDYGKKFTYRYKNETPVMNGANHDTVIRAANALVDKNDIIPKGTVLTVQVDAMDEGNYTGSLIGEYRITENSIVSASVVIPSQIYTGQEITLDKSQITVKARGKVIDSSQYEIVADSYKNNVKKGKASVTIKGVDTYGGTKTVKFTIRAKGFWW